MSTHQKNSKDVGEIFSQYIIKMQSLQIFQNDNYNIKTHVCHEIAYLIAKDVAKCLNYTNPQKAIRDHVYEEDEKKMSEL